MKTYLSAIALLTGIAAGPTSAYAFVWHCAAYPADDPSDQHEAKEPLRSDAEEEAMSKCQNIHDNCEIQCHVDE